jgi:hypothetical protein
MTEMFDSAIFDGALFDSAAVVPPIPSEGDFILLEDGYYLLLQDGSRIKLDAAAIVASQGGGGTIRRRRNNRIEGGLNLPFVDDDIRRKKIALQNAAIMVVLH